MQPEKSFAEKLPAATNENKDQEELEHEITLQRRLEEEEISQQIDQARLMPPSGSGGKEAARHEKLRRQGREVGKPPHTKPKRNDPKRRETIREREI